MQKNTLKHTLKNTLTTYGLVQRVLHWTSALLILSLLSVGYIMKYILPISDLKWQVYTIHKAIGVVTLGLVCLRFLWRVNNPIPKLPNSIPNWQFFAAKYNIITLYILMFLMPLSGIGMSLFANHPINFFNFFEIPAFLPNQTYSQFFNTAHYIIAFALIGFITLHFCAALYHHFIRHDYVLRRMFKGY